MRGYLPWVLLTFVASACGGAFERMPDRPVVWVDPDRRPFEPAPRQRYVSWRFDAVDHTFLRPVSDAFEFHGRQPSINVNALGEVPRSSWFENRIGRPGMTPEEVAIGACPELAPPIPRPWTVVGGKPDGTHPGLTIEDADGVRYLLKTDGLQQPERATAADAIAAALYYAAGYWAPCNRVAYVRRAELRMGEDARVEMSNGVERPLAEGDIERVLETALRAEDGRYRVGLSRFLEGESLGPWSYEGTRADDPNDVVPHQLRRDVRGLYLLAAWTGHIDSRQENTLSTWMQVTPDLGYVRHNLIDFGDAFGVTHDGAATSRRLGHDHFFNLTTIGIDLLTLGLVDRAWLHAPDEDRTHETLGYFESERFRPDEWAPTYPNPAFDARTEHDDAWMARILARFSRAHIEAAVRLGRFSRPEVRDRLVDILWERRLRILERYLTRLSPLAWPRSEPGRACLEDMTISAGIRSPEDRGYRAVLAVSLPPRRRAELRTEAEGAWVCVAVPEDVEYAAIDVEAATPGRDRAYPARLHVYAHPDGAPFVAGIARPTAHLERRR